MKTGHFYFIKEEFFTDFQDPLLMKNKETTDGRAGKRPCYFTFKDPKKELFWMIPISSKVVKYKEQYQRKMSKNKRCDTIVFGNVLGYEKAFLIQNMFPITEIYIESEYLDVNHHPVMLERTFEQTLLKKAKKVLLLERQGKRLLFPASLVIEQSLISCKEHSD